MFKPACYNIYVHCTSNFMFLSSTLSCLSIFLSWKSWFTLIHLIPIQYHSVHLAFSLSIFVSPFSDSEKSSYIYLFDQFPISTATPPFLQMLPSLLELWHSKSGWGHMGMAWSSCSDSDTHVEPLVCGWSLTLIDSDSQVRPPIS